MDNEQSQILLLLGEIKGQITGFITSLADVKDRADGHESRIRKLEDGHSRQKGWAAGVTAVATVSASVIVFIIEHFHIFG